MRQEKPFFAPEAILERIGQSRHERTFSRVLACFPSVSKAALLKQLSLHLPRFQPSENLIPDRILAEAERLAARLDALQAPCRHMLPVAGNAHSHLQEYHFRSVCYEDARTILERFHYLLSSRLHSIHLGLKADGKDKLPVAMVTLSPFDLTNVADSLPLAGGLPTNTLVLSRAFAFDAAPHNAMSFLFSRVRDWLSDEMPDVKLLVTYLNPNIGFSGASFKADNWTLLGREHGTRYCYVDGNYTTDREIFRMFGETPQTMSDSWLGRGVTLSQCELLPLNVLVRQTPKAGHRRQLDRLEFDRWSPRM